MLEKFTEDGLKVLNDEGAIQILKEMRLSPETIRKDIEIGLPAGNHILKYGDIPFSSRAQNGQSS